MSSNIYSQQIDADGFKQTTNKNFNRVSKLEQDLRNLQKRIHSPKVDLVERDQFYLIRIELPGVDLESINVQIKNSQIILISGNKQVNNIYETDRVVYRESKYDSFMRRVKLPGKVKYVKFNKGYLDFVNGVLNLTFEKDTIQEETTQEDNVQETVQEETVQEVQETTQDVSVNWADDI